MNEQKSKLLSFLLRHKPEAKNLKLDKEGWCDVLQLCRNADFTLEELQQIVAEDTKGRYTIRAEDGASFIRANQGHSTSAVKLTFKQAIPPVVLYHGADAKAVQQIWREGLKPMSRHHVHLSENLVTAHQVGSRRRTGYKIFQIDAKQMLTDGFKFFISENDVFLVDQVPPKYLMELA